MSKVEIHKHYSPEGDEIFSVHKEVSISYDGGRTCDMEMRCVGNYCDNDWRLRLHGGKDWKNKVKDI